LIRILHSVFIIWVLAFLFSCSSPETKEKEAQKVGIAQPERIAEIITAVKKKDSQIPVTGPLQPDTRFQYSTTINKKIGEFVDAPMSGVSPKSIKFKNELSQETQTFETGRYQTEINPVMLSVIFDNDIFDNTDYYYTNGVRFELVLPFAGQSPVNKILLGIKSSDFGFNGFSIQQNIYTPINPETTEIDYGDRPFAAYLTIGQFRETYQLERKLQIKSALDLGVMGPSSMGETVQSSIHYLEPTGWEYQMQNSFLINYYINIEKGLYSSSWLEINAIGQANVGTLYNKLGGGLNFRLGSFMPVYRGPATSVNYTGTKQWQYWFFMSGTTDFVAYDATLQGGLFNNKSPYVIADNELNRMIFKASAGLAVYYYRFGVELENFYYTPEFEEARHFMYGRIKLVANF